MKLALFLIALIASFLLQPASCADSRSRAAYNFVDHIVSSGVQRTFNVHVPGSYDRSRRMPLVMVFHGLGMNGQSMIYLTNFNAAADRSNFVVVYPDAIGHRWESSAGSDVQFVEDMINRLSSIISIDQRHIYAAGISNGGQFVQVLACASNRIAAIGVVASTFAQSAASGCGGNNREPVIFFVGTDDPLVPSSDSEHNEQLGKLGEAVGLAGLGSLSVPLAKMGGMLMAEENVEFWCEHNRCSLSPYTVQMPDVDPHDGTKVTRISYGSNDVVYYRIQGGGHTWPGAFYSGPRDLVGRNTGDINATELLTDFFLHH